MDLGEGKKYGFYYCQQCHQIVQLENPCSHEYQSNQQWCDLLEGFLSFYHFCLCVCNL